MIFHLFTLVLLSLKLAHVIDWSWWIVFMPSIFVAVMAALVAATGALLVFKVFR